MLNLGQRLRELASAEGSDASAEWSEEEKRRMHTRKKGLQALADSYTREKQNLKNQLCNLHRACGKRIGEALLNDDILNGLLDAHPQVNV